MKIVFTGGGTGGHFYPIIAVAQELQALVDEKKILEPELFFFAPTPYDERALFEHNITFVATPAGKLRRYFSLRNITDTVTTAFGCLDTLFKLYKIYPDVVFSKGGYGSVPTVMAARFLKIPLIIHDSDAIPGRATLLAASYAEKIGIAFPEAREYFPEKVRDRVAVVGTPVRHEVASPAREGAHEFLELDTSVPTILVLGGSSGSEKINDVILSALPQLVNRYQVVHQTGAALYQSVLETSKVILEKNERRYRYKAYDFLSSLALKMAAGVADLVISRAGTGTIAEISSWGKAALLIPIPETVSRDQRLNAFAYAHAGGATVIEESNLTPNLLVAEVDRLFVNPKARLDMAEAAKKFAKPDAARTLAQAILDTALEHET